MKFEKLRQLVEEFESVLRSEHDFSDRDLSTARSNGMGRSWNWFNDLTGRTQIAVTAYQTALRKLTSEEKKEIEELKRTK